MKTNLFKWVLGGLGVVVIYDILFGEDVFKYIKNPNPEFIAMKPGDYGQTIPWLKDVGKLELSHIGMLSEDGGAGIPYMQSSFTSIDKTIIIKPGKVFIADRELKGFFSPHPEYKDVLTSKQDFNVVCTVRYQGNAYPCSKLRMKIN